MNYLSHLLRSKGFLNLLRRPFMIYRRFGLANSRSVAAIDRILEITRKHECKASFFITADLLDRHSGLIRRIAHSGAHIGLHGHHHIDHGRLSLRAQAAEIAAGLKKFREHEIEPTGFRGPFLRFNDKTSQAASENNISWLSHSVILLNHNAATSGFRVHSAVRPLLKDFYTELFHDRRACLPFRDDSCLDVPICLPDDEMLIDRLGIRDCASLTRIWTTMFDLTHKQGELLNLLFHPERAGDFAKPLDELLKTALTRGDVWIASLEDIANWWHERSLFTARVEEVGPNAYRATVDCTARGSVILQYPAGRIELIEPGQDGSFALHTGRKPVISATAGVPEQTVRAFLNHGFILERGDDPSRYALALDANTPRRSRESLHVLLSGARGPLLRFWPWPRPFQSAFSFSLDLDAVTFGDFLRRVWYFYKAYP